MQVRFFTSAMAAILASSFVLGMIPQKKPVVVPPPRVTARSAERPCMVPPKSWSPERLQPWAAKSMVPQPPDAPPPKRLLQQRLFKCLTNVYNLGKMEDNASMIAHAREAASLKVELKTYLRTQQKHGAVVFPRIEAWPVVKMISTQFCFPRLGGRFPINIDLGSRICWQLEYSLSIFNSSSNVKLV